MKGKLFSAVAAVLLLFALFLGYFYSSKNGSALADRSDPVYTYFIGTQNDADCILVRQGGADILIDTGEKSDGAAIVDFLREKGIDTIEYLVLTHPDKDHIGGAAEVLQSFPVEQIIMPYYPDTNKTLEHLLQVAQEQKVNIITPTRTRSFSLGGMEMTIFRPLEKHYKYDNNYSLVTLINHNEVNMLFTGDAMDKRIQELGEIHFPQITLLKAPYHGRYAESFPAFLESIRPQYTVVTSDQADPEIVTALQNVGAEIYYSVPDTVAFESDGHKMVPIGENDEKY